MLFVQLIYGYKYELIDEFYLHFSDLEMIVPSVEEDFEKLYINSPDTFFDELKAELTYYHRTKSITFLDIYRIRRRLLPMLDVWVASRNKVYESFLKTHENLLIYALRYEPSLSDVTTLANDSRYILRNVLKMFLDST